MKFVFKKYFPGSYWVGLLVIAFLIRIYLFSRRKDSATTLDIFNILQIGITFTIGTVLIARKDSFYIFRQLLKSPLGWLMIVYLIGMISGLWSTIPLFSTYFGFEGIVFLMALAVILFQQPSDSDMEITVIRLSFLIAIFMIAEIIRFQGFKINLFHWHTNTYSTVAAMLFGYSYGEINNKYRENTREDRHRLKLSMWLSLFLVLLGTSSASNIALLSAVVVVTLISGRKTLKLAALLILGVTLLINQIYGDIFFNVLFPGKTIESVQILHGRMNLWERYYALIEQKPYFGWGYAAISRVSDLYNIHSHNSIIEILGGLGVVGLIPTILYLLSLYVRLIINVHSPYILGTVGAITAGLVNSNSISFIGSPTSGILLSFLGWNLLAWFCIIKINQNENQLTN